MEMKEDWYTKIRAPEHVALCECFHIQWLGCMSSYILIWMLGLCSSPGYHIQWLRCAILCAPFGSELGTRAGNGYKPFIIEVKETFSHLSLGQWRNLFHSNLNFHSNNIECMKSIRFSMLQVGDMNWDELAGGHTTLHKWEKLCQTNLHLQ